MTSRSKASVGGLLQRRMYHIRSRRRFALVISQAQVVENLYIYKNFIVEIKATLISDLTAIIVSYCKCKISDVYLTFLKGVNY